MQVIEIERFLSWFSYIVIKFTPWNHFKEFSIFVDFFENGGKQILITI